MAVKIENQYTGKLPRNTLANVETALASVPRRPAKGFCHLSAEAGGLGGVPGNAPAATGCSPRSPARMRSGVNGNSRKRTPVAAKIALPIAAALGTDADSPTPSGG